MVKTVINLLGTLTLLGDGIIVAILVAWILERLKLSTLFSQIKKVLSPISYTGAFIVSLISTLGSLFFSEIAKFQPCLLCWYQRIFMYPQAILIYTSMVRNEKVLKPYLIVLNSIGAFIAAYHYLIQRLPQTSILPCSIGGEVSCTKDYTLQYGYITIPLMALTAFILNIILLSLSNKQKK